MINIKKIDDFKFRASSLKNLYSNIRVKKDYCAKLVSQVVRGYEDDILSTLPIIKGNENEGFSEKILKTIFNDKDFIYTSLLPKNHPLRDVTKGNLRGTCDIISNKHDAVIDIKNAYSWDTFDKNNEADILETYKKQLTAYMHLYDKNNAYIVYILTQIPEYLMVEEERKLFYKNQFLFQDIEGESYLQACKNLRNKFDVSKFSILERIKVVHFERNNVDEAFMLDNVDEAKKMMKNIYTNWQKNTEKNYDFIEKMGRN